jgi:ketosteroid isomerase-like protein
MYHQLITQLVQAMNAHNSDGVVACFTDQAIVCDEECDRCGLAAIKAWIEDAFQKYQFKIEVIEVAGGGDEISFNGRVSGTFDGSPIELLHQITVRHGKIASLVIEPAPVPER